MHGWNKWHHRFLDLAAHVAEWSKDPSTKTGAVIVRPDRSIVSVGYNGFPRGVNDSYERLNDRPIKYAMVTHAEVNAILSAHGPVEGCTIYVHPWPPCSSCAGAVIQAGIKRVVSVEPTPEQEERWGDSFNIMRTMFREAGVRLDTVPARWLD
jgi:dCMP deaminase